MWEPQPLATLRAYTAYPRITIPFYYSSYNLSVKKYPSHNWVWDVGMSNLVARRQRQRQSIPHE
jgi:hypothetical protein